MGKSNIHVIVISSVRPEPTSAGQIILHRHLVDRPGITLEVYGTEPRMLSASSLVRRLVGRLCRTRWQDLTENFWVLWQGQWLDPLLPKHVENPESTVVLTVAHGDGCYAAQRFATKHQLPLVSFFHDWWPDIPPVHRSFRKSIDESFRKLYTASQAALCVSEKMREDLGPHSNAVVLPPIPASFSTPAASVESADSSLFRLLYSGNLAEYGPMLGEALEATLDQPGLLLQVRGSNPQWPEKTRDRMKENGRWLEFAPRAELDAWFRSADAFLIPMVFEPAMRRRMQTSFPSKLIEFSQFGKPLVIWGPDDCSAIRWGRQNKRAICVTDPDPVAIVSAFRKLAESTSEQLLYSNATVEVACGEFNPARIQDQFVRELSRCCSVG
jgi:glycosyltransferase involved in cell wall biosynthesis